MKKSNLEKIEELKEHSRLMWGHAVKYDELHSELLEAQINGEIVLPEDFFKEYESLLEYFEGYVEFEKGRDK